jgi:hypothetical protein
MAAINSPSPSPAPVTPTGFGVTVLSAWVVFALVILVIAVLLGVKTIRKGPTGILIDTRNRYSLTHFQLVLWTIVIVSLISGVFWGRLIATANPSTALAFSIPPELLGVLGISVGSAVTSTVVKTQKDQTVPERIGASGIVTTEPRDGNASHRPSPPSGRRPAILVTSTRPRRR